MKRSITFILSGLIYFLPLMAGNTTDIITATSGMKKLTGYFNLYLDDHNGKIFMEIDRWEQEFLLVYYLSGGIGSNDIGLDRGQIGGEYVVYFRRVGPKVLLIQPNYGFRAEMGSDKEKRAVQESFASSVLWGFKVAATTGNRVLVDATDFFVRDVRNVAGVLMRSGQGSYRFNPERSALNPERTRNFPYNTEVDAIITLAGRPEGRWIREVTPTPEDVTVFEHTSLVKLPEQGYKPRHFDPRSGYFPLTYMDFSTSFDQPIEKRIILRHRLVKKDPDAMASEPVEPIVYYVDNSAPEPIRSALVEGASWWNQAFEAAGFRNAFRVEVLPDTADPLDIRYNVIQWVHRATRGWSYGGSVADPRTGEIIKGHVTLGSQRIRQDYLIGKALLSPFKEGEENDQAIEEMALARIRQLACHEVGHTLGLAHNYAASTFGRASVMDYPHPLIKLNKDGDIDLSDAYAVGVGEWDKIAIRYGYTEIPASVDENDSLRKILQDGISRGIYFLSDQDARPPGSASPVSHLWDNGTDPVAELKHLMKVRETALNRFGENALRMNEPLALLEDILVPLYLLPRYQITAAAKVIGGVDYRYNLKGDGQKLPEPVPGTKQREALNTLLWVVSPENLLLPDHLVRLFPPRPLGYPATRESFSGNTDPAFDALAPARDLSEITFSLILNAERAERMTRQHARDRSALSFDAVISEVLKHSWYAPHTGDDRRDQVLRVVDRIVLNKMIGLLQNPKTGPESREIGLSAVIDLETRLKRQVKKEKNPGWRAHYLYALEKITQAKKEGYNLHRKDENPVPPGQPIGNDALIFKN